LTPEFLGLAEGFFSNVAEESAAALKTFMRLVFYEEPTPEDFYFFLGFNTIVPPYVRAGLFDRTVENDDILAKVTKAGAAHPRGKRCAGPNGHGRIPQGKNRSRSAFLLPQCGPYAFLGEPGALQFRAAVFRPIPVIERREIIHECRSVSDKIRTDLSEKTALGARPQKLSYAQFNRRVNRLANALCKLGVQKGDRVAILQYNYPETLESIFACFKMGCGAVPINFRLHPKECAFIVDHSESNAVILSPEFNQAILEIKEPYTARPPSHFLVGR
jgi:hypothetical protein